jgi:hypothetical protein
VNPVGAKLRLDQGIVDAVVSALRSASGRTAVDARGGMMRHVGLLAAGVLAMGLAAPAFGPALAQDQSGEAAAEADAAAGAEVAADDAAADEDLLGDDELDALVAPVALYPDSLLSQIFVAATYPLDIVKADRFVEENAELPDDQRADLAEQQDWDPSVQVLAGGFPSVVSRMADEIDWTEQLGDAVLAQTDDVLDSIQRMRSRAVATGYLADNEAQVIEEDPETDNISIEPADPEVVYVPSYDSTAAFTTAPTTAPVVYATDDGWSAGDVMATGAIAFGGAMILDEIFEDDDDWDDYWHGPSSIDWDEDDFNPGRDVDIDGDVNFERNIDRGDRTIDRDRVNVDRDQARTKIGDIDRDNVDVGKRGSFQPSDQQRQEARDKIAARKQGRGEDGQGAKARAAGEKLKARDGADSEARAKLSQAAANRKPEANRGDKVSALKKGDHDRKQADRAKARAGASIDKGKARPAAQARPKASQPKKIAKANKPKPSAKKASKRSSAMKQHSGGKKAKAAKSRGGKSHAKRRR